MYINIALNNHIYIYNIENYVYIFIYTYIKARWKMEMYHCITQPITVHHGVPGHPTMWQDPSADDNPLFFDGAMTIPHDDPISLIVIIQLWTMTYKQKSDILYHIIYTYIHIYIYISNRNHTSLCLEMCHYLDGGSPFSHPGQSS